MKTTEITHQKEFMNKLLVSVSFDTFLLKEAALRTSVGSSIDGRENKAFYIKEQLENNISPYDYVTWAKIKSNILNIIKGQNTPLSMKIVLYAGPELTKEILSDELMSDVDYLALNFRFDESGMSLTTAVAYKAFTLDKEADRLWDSYIDKLIS